ncbi:nucleoside transporter-domain-containing protein [Sordaria brevicollis]|uniref:Nucleoside transporter-domain-containing protein n=1 Tax=Sordaria brevicollis TaxID=83679 RepID=A0AAE0U5Q8_SORBR|nr:nucleoside transporter-domain-containing protein [Sordaria brevicollis]
MSADQTSIRLRPIPTSSTEDPEHLEGSTTTTTTTITRNNRPPTIMERLKNFITTVKATDEEYEPLTDDTSSTLTAEGEILEETPFSWIEYFIFVLIGVAMLWAWNMFLAAAPYFQTRFESNEWILANSQSAILSVSTTANLLALLVLMNIQSSANYPLRIKSSLVATIAVFGLLTISTVAFRDVSATTYLVFLLLMVGASAWAAGMMQNGAFAFAASFGRPEYTQAIMAGQGVAGILPPLAQIVSYLAVDQSNESSDPPTLDDTPEASPDTSAFIYFLTAVIISLITLVAFYPLVTRHNKLVESRLDEDTQQQLLSQSITSLEEAECLRRHFVSPLTLFRKLNWIAASVSFCFVVAMFFPVFTAKIFSVHEVAEGETSIFAPGAFIPLGFFFWNLGDLLGRVSPMFLPFSLRDRPAALFAVAVARLVFLPMYLLCNIRGKGAVVDSDLFYLLVVQLPFGLTNGWLGASSMMAAGEWVEDGEREAAGGFMSMCLVGGLAVGSLASFSVAGL